MELDRDSAEPSRESPVRDVLLLVACVAGLLVGLGIFVFVCYLLLH
jgi:uncharacterized membrane protein